MIIGIALCIILFFVMHFSQSVNKIQLTKNPNDRESIIKYFNSCNDSNSYLNAAKYGEMYLNSHPQDYEILALTSRGYLEAGDVSNLKKILDDKIPKLEIIFNNPELLADQIKKGKLFRYHSMQLFYNYSDILKGINETTKSEHYENIAIQIENNMNNNIK